MMSLLCLKSLLSISLCNSQSLNAGVQGSALTGHCYYSESFTTTLLFPYLLYLQ